MIPKQEGRLKHNSQEDHISPKLMPDEHTDKVNYRVASLLKQINQGSNGIRQWPINLNTQLNKSKFTNVSIVNTTNKKTLL